MLSPILHLARCHSLACSPSLTHLFVPLSPLTRSFPLLFPSPNFPHTHTHAQVLLRGRGYIPHPVPLRLPRPVLSPGQQCSDPRTPWCVHPGSYGAHSKPHHPVRQWVLLHQRDCTSLPRGALWVCRPAVRPTVQRTLHGRWGRGIFDCERGGGGDKVCVPCLSVCDVGGCVGRGGRCHAPSTRSGPPPRHTGYRCTPTVFVFVAATSLSACTQ